MGAKRSRAPSPMVTEPMGCAGSAGRMVEPHPPFSAHKAITILYSSYAPFFRRCISGSASSASAILRMNARDKLR